MEPEATVNEPKRAWKGVGRHCANGNPFVCAAALADGITCAEGECDVVAGNRKLPKRPPRAPKTHPRKRKARWRAEHRGKLFLFEYDPGAGLLRVWQHRHRTKKTITIGEVLEAMDGQKLLPL